MSSCDRDAMTVCWKLELRTERLAQRVPFRVKAEATQAAVLKLFETDVLLVVREKELALDSSAHLADASSLVPRLPNAPAESLLSIVRGLPPDATAGRLLPPIREAPRTARRLRHVHRGRPVQPRLQGVSEAVASVRASDRCPVTGCDGRG